MDSFIKILLQHSVAINNFNAAAALIGGLSHSSVSRLRPTWEVFNYYNYYRYFNLRFAIIIIIYLTHCAESAGESDARFYQNDNNI